MPAPPAKTRRIELFGTAAFALDLAALVGTAGHVVRVGIRVGPPITIVASMAILRTAARLSLTADLLLASFDSFPAFIPLGGAAIIVSVRHE